MIYRCNDKKLYLTCSYTPSLLSVDTTVLCVVFGALFEHNCTTGISINISKNKYNHNFGANVRRFLIILTFQIALKRIRMIIKVMSTILQSINNVREIRFY